MPRVDKFLYESVHKAIGVCFNLIALQAGRRRSSPCIHSLKKLFLPSRSLYHRPGIIRTQRAVRNSGANFTKKSILESSIDPVNPAKKGNADSINVERSASWVFHSTRRTTNFADGAMTLTYGRQVNKASGSTHM